MVRMLAKVEGGEVVAVRPEDDVPEGASGWLVVDGDLERPHREDDPRAIYAGMSYTVHPDRVEVVHSFAPPSEVEANERKVRDRARQALDANSQYLAIKAPTNAQVVAQVRLLTMMANALIRLEIGEVEDVSDTQ